MIIPIEETQKPIVSLDVVKEYLNEISADKDAEITSLINAVVEDAENITNRKLSLTKWELYLSSLEDGFSFPKNPIKDIESIEYMNEDGIYEILDASKYYLYEECEVGKLKLLDLAKTKEHEKAIKITFNSGYEDIPEAIVTWIKYHVLCVYDGRKDEVNDFINDLINKYRIRGV